MLFAMSELLIVKTGALGDVLRTTSILPGMAERDPNLRVAWVTAPAAVPLVVDHPLVAQVESVDPKDTTLVAELAGEESFADAGVSEDVLRAILAAREDLPERAQACA